MKAVAYYRVSTAAQGRSGLGLDAQRDAVAEVCAAQGMEIVAEFTEIESGLASGDQVILRESAISTNEDFVTPPGPFGN